MIRFADLKGSTPLLFFGMFSLLSPYLAAQESAPVKLLSQKIKPSDVHFEDLARKVGLDVSNVYGGDAHKEFIIETTGNGAIIFDYDNDGWPDIYLPNGSTVEGFSKEQAPTGHLYHNNQDGTFSDVTQRSGSRAPAGGRAVASATTTMTVTSIYWSLTGDKTLCTTTMAMALSPM